MSGRIDRIFSTLRREGRAGLMPFMTAGYPSLAATAAALPILEQAGASIVELGIPFSDPIADGPVIAASMHEALEAGVTPAKVLDMVANVRSETTLGLIAMVSDSIVTRMGGPRFVTLAGEAGFDGLIIPDVDTAAAQPLHDAARDRGMSFSLLVAPSTPLPRLESIVSLCSGFVYLLGRAGLTGERNAAPEIAEPVRMIRSVTDLPIAVGFGIATGDHVAAVTAEADAAIVGSALVRRMGEAKDPAAAAGAFVGELAKALAARV